MNLKKQLKDGSGKASPWTIEQIEAGFRKFFEDHKRYPTATEIDEYEYLPSARTLERNFGGVVGVRKNLKLGEDFDFRKGAHSSRRSHTINKRSNIIEQKVYEYLLGKFNKEFIHREYLFTDDARTRADFFVYDVKEGFCIDVFYPSSIRSLGTCLILKLQKYKGTGSLLSYPVIFLQMNTEISQERIEELIKRKKSSMPGNYYVMNWETFQKFCSDRKPLKAYKT